MGVIPTPTNFKTLTFDGENSRSYGVYITGEGVFNAPERNVEMVEIPGRNGAFALDKGNFNNIEVTYPAGIFADTEADFAQAVSDFRNFLCSKVGYVRLEDDYNPNEYRLAIYKSGLEVDHDLLIAGEFDLVFDCKPQRYLKSGETPITIGEWGETTTYTGAIAQFENPNGYLAVKSLTVDIEPIQAGSGTPSPDNVRPITGWTGCEVSQAGVNLANFVDGYTVDAQGQVTPIANRCATVNPIKIDANETYYVKSFGTAFFIYAVFNGNTLVRRTAGIASGVALDTSGGDKLYVCAYDGTVDTTLPMVTKGSVATDYTPYNGTTYNITWQTEAGTVYGGTVDVVSGVLTVNKVSTTISSFSNRAGTATTGKYRFYTSAYSDALAPSSTSVVTTAICNEFNATSNANTYSNVTGFSLHHTEKRFYFYSDVLAELSLADANTWLSSNPIQVVYELATPITYQLDPVQVACLFGQNNVWNNIADTSIEVGNDPQYVINPTRFDAQPILQANGKGGIFFGDVTAATITESYIGEIELSSSVSNSGVPSGSTVSVESVLTGTDALNEGDTITVSGVKWTVNVTVSKNITSAVATSVSNCTVTVSKSGKTATYQVTLDEVQFSKGTDATSTNASFGVNITYSDGGFVATYVFNCQYRASANKVTAICQYPNDGNWSCVIPAIRGDSTKSSLPNEIYIDLDIGEAYYYDANDDVVSLNNVVSIPADLPVIPAGSTPISYDNTITNLKVVPRWWKV